MTPTIQQIITVQFTHRVYFTRSVFEPENRLLMELLIPSMKGGMAKAIVMIDQGVADAFPELSEQAVFYFSRDNSSVQLACPPLIFPGGETAKNNSQLIQQIYSQIEQHGICRHSYLLAIGGGAFLDVVGFAAATAHRGVRHVRLPTTTLAQADAGVGLKNGINLFGRKNFAGTFSPPFAVINDSDLWQSLSLVEKRAGLIEAIKVALIRDASFFSRLESLADALCKAKRESMEQVIRHCAELHVQHIAESGDPFESGSARPLDFGHWSAHQLEQMSQFTISHGSAVALGLALDTLYSHKKGMLSREETDRVFRLLKKLKFALFDPLMRKTGDDGHWLILDGLEKFREHLGGELTVTLLEGIGQGVEVHEMYCELIKQCIMELKENIF